MLYLFSASRAIARTKYQAENLINKYFNCESALRLKIYFSRVGEYMGFLRKNRVNRQAKLRGLKRARILRASTIQKKRAEKYDGCI